MTRNQTSKKLSFQNENGSLIYKERNKAERSRILFYYSQLKASVGKQETNWGKVKPYCCVVPRRTLAECVEMSAVTITIYIQKMFHEIRNTNGRWTFTSTITTKYIYGTESQEVQNWYNSLWKAKMLGEAGCCSLCNFVGMGVFIRAFGTDLLF